MTHWTIRTAGLGKRYHIRAQGKKQPVWALREVDLEVQRGEVLGVVGRNGAGKSTLLKILSRITLPTTGTAQLRGRVGALLEVGTGFHPELTGRENVLLAGVLLGLRRREVKARFDDIVSFAQVERYIDTPVKHYSSGMQVRLAFAVAAHLQPEILIIDEVLAVGDAAFQQRCLGRLEDAREQGRTVLFVSHNLAAVRSLCTRAVRLEGGRLTGEGAPAEVVSAYLHDALDNNRVPLGQRTDRRGRGTLRFVELTTHGATRAAAPVCGEPLTVRAAYECAKDPPPHLRVAISFVDDRGLRLFACDTQLTGDDFTGLAPRGVLTLHLPQLPLMGGRYTLNLWASAGGEVLDHLEGAGRIIVSDGDPFGTGRVPRADKQGPLVVRGQWSLEPR